MAQVAAGFQLQRPVSLAVSREREAEQAWRLGGDERLPQRRPLDLVSVVEHVASLAAGNDGAELANLVVSTPSPPFIRSSGVSAAGVTMSTRFLARSFSLRT